MLLVGDWSAAWVERIREDFPAQYLNCGIAEANMVSVAAGLALAGKRPYVCGINNFITLRAFEQVSVDVCTMQLPVTFVGVGAGYTYSTDGPTHHGVCDLGAMMALPCEIFNCSDAIVTDWIARDQANVPRYVRLERGELPEFQTAYAFEHGLRVLRFGEAWLLGSGYMVSELMKEDPSYGVIDLFRVKPINEELLRFVVGKKPVIVVEDNLHGPIHKAVSAVIGKCQSVAPQGHVFQYGQRDFVHRHAGILA